MISKRGAGADLEFFTGDVQNDEKEKTIIKKLKGIPSYFFRKNSGWKNKVAIIVWTLKNHSLLFSEVIDQYSFHNSSYWRPVQG